MASNLEIIYGRHGHIGNLWTICDDTVAAGVFKLFVEHSGRPNAKLEVKGKNPAGETEWIAVDFSEILAIEVTELKID